MCQYTTLWNISVLKATIENMVSAHSVVLPAWVHHSLLVQQEGRHIEHLMLNLHDVTVKAYFRQ